MYGLTVISAPAEEPVSLDRAKAHLRVDHDAEDELIAGLVRAARELTETHCKRAWIEQGLRLSLADWESSGSNQQTFRSCSFFGFGTGGVVRIPVAPVTSIDAVKYYSTGGTLTTLDPSAYQTWLDHSPPLVAPAPLTLWPVAQVGRLAAVQVEFTAGYGDSDDVPEQAKAAILLCLAFWYENRGDGADPTVMSGLPQILGMPWAAKRLLDSLSTGGYQ